MAQVFLASGTMEPLGTGAKRLAKAVELASASVQTLVGACVCTLTTLCCCCNQLQGRSGAISKGVFPGMTSHCFVNETITLC